jgi:hypothetical protein
VVATLLGLAVALVPACSRRESVPAVPPAAAAPSGVVVEQVTVEDLTSQADRPQGFALPALEATAREQLGRGSALRMLGAGAAGVPADLELAVLYALVDEQGKTHAQPGPGVHLSAGVQARLTIRLAGEPERALQAERLGREPAAQEAGAAREALAAMLPRLAGEAVALLERQAVVLTGDQAAVVRAINDAEAQVQAFAIEVAGERHLHAAVPSLLELLKRPDRALVAKAIGALGQIGSDTATPALAQLGGGDQPQESVAAIQALADIGTREAKRYLQAIRDTTPFDDVRREAEEALKRIP